VICRVLEVARSTAYYQARDRAVVVDDVLAQRIKHLIDAEPYLGYRMVWARLRMRGVKVNRKAVQRLMQLKGWQCHRRLRKRCKPRVEVATSVVESSNLRWATDTTYIWTRLDGLVYLNAVLDCGDRECVGFNVSQRNDAREAAWALEDALLKRFGALPTADCGVTLRTDNALIYASELYRTGRGRLQLPTAVLTPRPHKEGAVGTAGRRRIACNSTGS
jgi:transposase InsO family protein